MRHLTAIATLLTLGCTVGAAHALSVSVTPACPDPSAMISILLSQSAPPPVILPSDPLITRDGTSYRVVVDASTTVFDAPTVTSKRIGLGALPVGTYHLDVFYRFTASSGSTEEWAGDAAFVVDERAANAAPCAASVITATQGTLQATAVDSPFAHSMQVRVSDGQERPVAGAVVTFERRLRPDDRFVEVSAQPRAILGSTEALTDAAGVAMTTAFANGMPGTYQYVARIKTSTAPPAHFTLANRSEATALPVTATAVIEYVNDARGHYFLTADRDEAAGLDRGDAPGWARTGGVFLAYEPRQPSTDGADPVCRFYGRPKAGLDSHFYSASAAECAAVEARFAASWGLETANAFALVLPDTVTGACPPNSRPVYRAFNNRVDVNHRYSPSKGVIGDMERFHWIAEGYGPDAVVMCAIA